MAEHAKSELHVGLRELPYGQEPPGDKERRGSVGLLRLVPQPATGSTRSLVDMEYPGQSAYVDIKAPSVAGEPDVAAVGATVRADVGKPFDVKVGIRNDGTAPTHKGRIEHLSVRIPKGVDVQLADKRCRRTTTPPSALYACEHDGHVLHPGESALFGFRMQVTRPLAETNGFVYRYGFDEGKGNNVNDESQLTISTSTPPNVSTPNRHDAPPVIGIAAGSAAALGGCLSVLVIRRRALDGSAGYPQGCGSEEWGIIPGPVGTESYIVRGLGNEKSFNSASHGAGRRMSRTAAKRKFTAKDLEEQTRGVECREDSGVVDEIPSAYKPIGQVIDQQKDLVQVVAKLKQVICVKG
ncbi:hypothetical protein QFZ67_003268 [Streptomyces sp. V1I1]|nr:hypothetical protein [Streptomyces sp. V1I1]